MSARTGIEWTDATWNPTVGCDRVSPGCAHCYAKQLHDQRHTAHLAGKLQAVQYAHPFEVVQLKPERLAHPLSWRTPKRIFVNSVSDLFHDAVPDEYLHRVFAVMALASRHTFQVLTKRPARMQAYVTQLGRSIEPLEHAARGLGRTFRWQGLSLLPWPIPNVWLGVSVENQRWANERIPLLLDTPAAVRFLSCEPLLGPLDLKRVSHRVAAGSRVTFDALDRHGLHQWTDTGVDWVIVGGESGPKARPMAAAWVRDLAAQCDSAGAAFFFKQWGGRTPKSGGRELDGRTWEALPLRAEVAHA